MCAGIAIAIPVGRAEEEDMMREASLGTYMHVHVYMYVYKTRVVTPYQRHLPRHFLPSFVVCRPNRTPISIIICSCHVMSSRSIVLAAGCM
jgi:hypothetical protein